MGNFKYEEKLHRARAKARVHSPNCGHSMLLGLQDKVICDWCKHYVFKDKQAEFKYRLKEQLLKKWSNLSISKVYDIIWLVD